MHSARQGGGHLVQDARDEHVRGIRKSRRPGRSDRLRSLLARDSLRREVGSDSRARRADALHSISAAGRILQLALVPSLASLGVIIACPDPEHDHQYTWLDTKRRETRSASHAANQYLRTTGN